MIVIFDENLPPKLPRILEILEIAARHASDIVARGTPDDLLVQAVATLGGCLFSRDGQMLHNVATVAALRHHQVRLVVFDDAQLNALELARLMMWAWPEVDRQLKAGKWQFMEITPRGHVREKKLRR